MKPATVVAALCLVSCSTVEPTGRVVKRVEAVVISRDSFTHYTTQPMMVGKMIVMNQIPHYEQVPQLVTAAVDSAGRVCILPDGYAIAPGRQYWCEWRERESAWVPWRNASEAFAIIEAQRVPTPKRRSAR